MCSAKGILFAFRKSRVELLVSTDPNERVLEFFSVSSAPSAFHGSLTGPLLFQKQDAVGGTKLNAEDTEAQRKSIEIFDFGPTTLARTCIPRWYEFREYSNATQKEKPAGKRACRQD